MSDYMICNTIPAYAEAPVSYEMLKIDAPLILNAILEKQEKVKYLIVDKNDNELASILDEWEQSKAGNDIRIIGVDCKSGFTYGNATAAIKVIGGEKPIPSGMDQDVPVYSVEDLLGLSEKKVFINGSSRLKGAFSFPREVTSRAILEQCGSVKEFKGLYFGYPMGLFVSAEQLDVEIKLTTDLVTILDTGDCILDRLAAIKKTYQKESCGRCVFGYDGVMQINRILSDILQRRCKIGDLTLLMDLCSEMKKQSLCDIGAAAARSVETAITGFKGEIEGHILKNTCKAAVCNKFVTFHVLDNKCVGCNKCRSACVNDAIQGEQGFIHVIDLDECTKCGACVDVCREKAIVKAGLIKPRGLKQPIQCNK
jgi:NADH-quinone oxidoreductase subunit F